MSDVFRERVTRGAELLDAREPTWFKTINTDRLVMSGCFHCVLGQLLGAYEPSKLGLSPRDAEQHGFVMDDWDDRPYEDEAAYNRLELLYPGREETFDVERFDYIILTAYWEDAIRDRRRQHTAQR